MSKKQVRAEILFRSMNHIYDGLEEIREVAVQSEGRMHEMALSSESYALIAALDDALAAMDDFLPGLEMEAHGEE